MQIIYPPSNNVGSGTGNALRYSQGMPPNSLGIDNDFCVDTQNKRLYGPKINGTWSTGYIDLSGSQGSSGADLKSMPSLRVTSNGAQTVTLPVANPVLVLLYLNGLQQPDTVFTVSGQTMTISSDLNAKIGDYIDIDYEDTLSSGGSGGGGGSGSNYIPVREVPQGNLNGINNRFVISYIPINNTLQLFLNGNLMDDDEYSLAGTNVTLSVPPVSTSKLKACYSR